MGDLIDSVLQNIGSVDIYIYQILLIDLTIAVIMIAGLRFIMGLVANVNSAEELASRDNVAFGIAMAGGIVSLALMLTGAVSGEPGSTYLDEVISVLSYGVLGLILIKVGRYFQDKLLFTEIEIQSEIKAGNLAAALVDAANTIATGLVLRAVMLWVESDTLDGILVVLAAFVLTQLLLALVTKYRLVVYSKRHSGESLQQALKSGQVALSVRFFGHLIGVALALTAASGVVSYNPDGLLAALVLWSAITIFFAIMVSLLAIVARNVILMGIDVVEEVNKQNNIGVAAIEASIYIAIGLFFTALFS
ncbi:MAG: uncharacterized membrane protein YjfL (UPF0719 family) [Flavobacterium sp.]|jgi:uncharacterized membrane protein YjfL (UPF0719 family)